MLDNKTYEEKFHQKLHFMKKLFVQQE